MKWLEAIVWRPGFHDHYLMGWIITVAYMVAAALCLAAWYQATRKARNHRHKEQPWLWAGLFLFLLFLGINKQVDFQTLFIQFGRHLALEQEWYEMRRQVQHHFVLLLVVAGVILSVLFGWYLARQRSSMKELWPIGIGLGCIAVFILVRAASFNHVDYLLSQWRVIGPFRMKYVAELGGIVAMGIGAAIKLARQRQLN